MYSKKVWITLIVVFFLAGAAGSYLFMREFSPGGNADGKRFMGSSQNSEDFFSVRLFIPSADRLVTVEKSLPKRNRQVSIAEAVIEAFFKASEEDKNANIPRNVKILGLYRDQDQILYIDLSDEVRRNFQGDALSEYLLLKGIYESLVSNLQDFQDAKILVEGKELETLGGHLFLNYKLKSIVSYDLKGDIRSRND